MSPGDPAADLRRGIAALLRGERPRPENEPRTDGSGVRRDGGLLELPGAEILDSGGAPVFCIRRDVSELLPGNGLAGALAAGLERLRREPPERMDRGLAPARGASLRDLLILDLETTGFWGCPIFLVGMLRLEGESLVVRQFLARDYAEEAPVLAAASELLGPGTVLVSFNGKSYDVPCFCERAALHRVGTVLRTLPHVDLLHPARRRWRDSLPDCRLQTLEGRVVGVHRQGDVPSAQVPEVYHRFVAEGRTEALRPVLHHSRVDLLTTARLFAALAAPVPESGRTPGRPKLLPLSG